MDSKLVQPLNACSSIITAPPKDTDVKLVQPENRQYEIVVKVLGSMTDVKYVQSLKELEPIDFTFLPISKDLMPEP